MAEKRHWHACCMMNGMTGPAAGDDQRRDTVTTKTSFLSAVAALFLGSLFVGSAVLPATVVAAAPVAASANA
jgi:hypothetical protein